MKRLQDDLFPLDFKKTAASIFNVPQLAAILLRQPAPIDVAKYLSDASSSSPTLLHPGEITRLTSYRLEKRRAEFLTGRICAKLALRRYWKMMGQDLPEHLKNIEITSDNSGRPHLKVSGVMKDRLPEISITHCGAFGAALAATLPCGIDLQQQRDNLKRVREKYCTPEELFLLEKGFPELAPLPRLSLLWTAKEAAKKMLSYRQMPGFLELELLPSTKTLGNCYCLTLAVKVDKECRLPNVVTVLTTTFADYGLAACILPKEQCYA